MTHDLCSVFDPGSDHRTRTRRVKFRAGGPCWPGPGRASGTADHRAHYVISRIRSRGRTHVGGH
eukprot:46340-Hanusia_phi.AAC.5